MARQSQSTDSPIARVGSAVGLILGLAITAGSMSSGFIWASQGEVLLVYVAGFTSWSGYLVAHYAEEGVFVDDMGESTDAPTMNGAADTGGQGAGGVLGQLRAILPDGPAAFGFLAGIVILVAGIAILAWYVRMENHLLGNVGSGMFLGGYVLAHYFDSGKFL
ncbi:hypothetical protein HLRTI_001635 [Halorhabdus tiamatea SARL4B]|uniref:Conserved hypothetical membrane protein n=1 Tax=Halorhabdus tiamatea SARL4B TaxID=1033806 RepID=F7PG46_9EURY|nr:hypothetical protein [Halorhabdus tiamatea]ERJ06290.1 hypothetical protein HLRTI_001635 [Halorhabdus tiamatea SARL4B]CCQ34657.1 conserved hypothetical membrane protein [Halorhabdus tiamatea SARL4B]